MLSIRQSRFGNWRKGHGIYARGSQIYSHKYHVSPKPSSSKQIGPFTVLLCVFLLKYNILTEGDDSFLPLPLTRIAVINSGSDRFLNISPLRTPRVLVLEYVLGEVPFGPRVLALTLCCSPPSYSIQVLTEAAVPGGYLSEWIDDTIGPLSPSFEVRQNGFDGTLVSTALNFEPCLLYLQSMLVCVQP